MPLGLVLNILGTGGNHAREFIELARHVFKSPSGCAQPRHFNAGQHAERICFTGNGVLFLGERRQVFKHFCFAAENCTDRRNRFDALLNELTCGPIQFARHRDEGLSPIFLNATDDAGGESKNQLNFRFQLFELGCHGANVLPGRRQERLQLFASTADRGADFVGDDRAGLFRSFRTLNPPRSAMVLKGARGSIRLRRPGKLPEQPVPGSPLIRMRIPSCSSSASSAGVFFEVVFATSLIFISSRKCNQLADRPSNR